MGFGICGGVFGFVALTWVCGLVSFLCVFGAVFGCLLGDVAGGCCYVVYLRVLVYRYFGDLICEWRGVGIWELRFVDC